MTAALNLDHCPPAWRDGLQNLDTRDVPIAGFAYHRWDRLLADARWFLDQWSGRATELGWTTLDLFGAHPIAPAARVDCAGLLILLHGSSVQQLDRTHAHLLSPAGYPLRYRKPARGAVPLWEIQ